MRVIDLQTLNYRDAWSEQERVHAQVLEGAEEAILLVEHTPVITFGRRAEDSARHLVASRDLLTKMGVELVESDRGGDITFHGPGQLVAYPIVRLADHQLSVGAYVKTLENAAIQTLAHFGVKSHLDPGAIGVWTSVGKICALGVRIKRGISLHGIALNVTTDLSYFNLIVPCGISGKPVTSMVQILQKNVPPIDDIKRMLVDRITACVAGGRRNNALR
jgi:lipoate-protein ligase B